MSRLVGVGKQQEASILPVGASLHLPPFFIYYLSLMFSTLIIINHH